MTRTPPPTTSRAARIALLVLAFIAPPAIAGGLTLYLRMRTQDVPEAAIREDIATPPARRPVTTKRLAVVVAGNRGTEITDSLPMIELLEESGAFEVRVVAPRRVLSPFKSSAFASPGLDFFPDLGFEDYDQIVGRAPDLVVVPYLPAWEREDAAVVPWIRSHVGPDTMLLSICEGAQIVAATGLFDGHRATGHFMHLDDLAAKYPRITYVTDVRWVRDGKRISSAALAAGLDATLAAIDTLAGRDAALRAAAGISYRHLEFLDDPASPTSVSLVGAALEIAYRWEHTRVAVVIGNGTSESSIAALFDAYAQTLSAHSVAVATSSTVLETRHGLRVLARDTTSNLGSYSTVTFATLDHGGLSAYDAAIYAVANTHGRPMARLAGRLINYPTSDLDLAGGVPVGLTMFLRALALGLAGIGGLLLLRSRSAARFVASGAGSG